MRMERIATCGLRAAWMTACALAPLVLALTGAVTDARGERAQHRCTNTAILARRSCRAQARADYLLALGKCQNLPDGAARRACDRTALADLDDALGECRDQRDARVALCGALGEGAYDPAIDPANFVPAVTNPYLPFVPGTRWLYETVTPGGLERIEVRVTEETKTILGVPCVVVRDTAALNGETTEDTLDWYAQDLAGNVWYFGEHSEQYENGVLVSLEGSWEAGVDGARPGIVMLAAPSVGQVYRQEFALGEAEDVAQVLGLNQAATVPYGSFTNCLQTKDFSPLEPEVTENKYFAPGIGSVLEVDLSTGERTELVAFDTK